VKPQYVAEISFTEWTRDGRARHPVFVGLREDKSAKEIGVETPRPVEEEIEEIAPSELVSDAKASSKKSAATKARTARSSSKTETGTSKSSVRAKRVNDSKTKQSGTTTSSVRAKRVNDSKSKKTAARKSDVRAKGASSSRRSSPESLLAQDGETESRRRPTRTASRKTSTDEYEIPPIRFEIAGVRLSHPDRVYFPEVGITKSELATYYERMAERVLPGLVHRPLSLVRCPEGREGECFYQKHADRTVPASVPRVVVKEGRNPYAMIDDLSSLVSLVQIGVLEFHVWGARADRLDRPDLLIVDLDPDPSVGWPRLAEAALLLRVLFEEFGLVAFVRSTGGKGLHVVVPLKRGVTWEALKEFAYEAALQLVRTAPTQFTANMAKAKRGGKIFLDVFRNAPEATAIASWSTRARPDAPVAATLAWDELSSKKQPLVLLRDAVSRLAEPDPWADFESSRRPITKEMRDRMRALTKSGAR
jgi:bifunctional non-homologous end joining protein LigD